MVNKRQHKRFPVAINAKVLFDGKSFDGIIGNISEEGIMHTITTFVQTPAGFTPKKSIQLNFKTPLGEAVTLNCSVMWFLSPSSEKKSLIVGLKIIDPPPPYIKWINKHE